LKRRGRLVARFSGLAGRSPGIYARLQSTDRLEQPIRIAKAVNRQATVAASLSLSRRKDMLSSISRRELVASGAVLFGASAASGLAADVAGDGPGFKLGTITYNVAKDWDLP